MKRIAPGQRKKGFMGVVARMVDQVMKASRTTPADKKEVGAFLPHYHVPYRGKDRNPQWKKACAKQKPASKQYGPMERRRRQIERGILNTDNGLVRAPLCAVNE